MPLDRSQVGRMIDSMERALTRMEQNQEARHDAEDREQEEDCDDELAEGNTFPTPKQPPFSDGAPQRIHGTGREDLFS
jgi:hypothetical protein